MNINEKMKIIEKIAGWHKKFFYGKEAKVFLLFVSLILFKNPIESLFNQYLISPFLSEVAENPYSDYCFMVVAILIIVYFIPKFFTRYIISSDLIILANVYLFSYLILYRLNPEYDFKWAYFDWKYLNGIAYVDIFLLYVLGINVLLIKSIVQKIVPNFNTENKAQLRDLFSFEEDKPISSFKEDLLFRKELAEAIAFTIKETNPSKSSAFGVVGEWGTGKTSLMNLVKLYLNKKEFVVIDFSPWISFSKNDIIHDFFKSISNELETSSSELPDLLMSYAKGISEDKSFGILSFFTNLFEKPDYNLQAKKIDSILKKINKRIVVFIDDLDRVESSVIIHIIQLIRSSADFKNLIFVVGYDKGYITNAIKSVNDYNSEHYLEKIFLNEFTLPTIDEETLKHYMTQSLRNAFPEDLDLSDAFNKKNGFGQKYNTFNKDIIKTIRDAKRFVNFFTSSYSKSSINGEVFVEDFLKIELLRYKYYLVYRLLETKSSQFFTSPKQKVIGHNTEVRYVLNKDGEECILENKIRENANELLISQNDVGIIMQLLNSIFYEKKDYFNLISDRNQLSIIYAKNFKKYFSRRISQDELSHKQFVKFYTMPFGQLQPKVIQWLNEGKQTLVIDKFNKIDLKEIKDIESYEKLIKIYFELGRYKDPNSNKLFQYPDVDDLISRIQWNKVTQDIYNDKKDVFADFISDLISNAPYPYQFDSSLLSKVNESFHYDFILSKKEVEQLRLVYLSDFCKHTPTFSSDVWNLMDDCEIVTWIPNGGGSVTKETKKIPKA